MAAITMVSTNSLVVRLKADYPTINFVAENRFRFDSAAQTIAYISDSTDVAQLFHELGHAVCGHDSYTQDIELIGIEKEAWEMAKQLAPKYGLEIPADVIDSAMDTYRVWLHARSRCPRCKSGGIQKHATGDYACFACDTKWRANDAKVCNLRRFRLLAD